MLESRTRGAGQTGRTTAHIMTWVRAVEWAGVALQANPELVPWREGSSLGWLGGKSCIAWCGTAPQHNTRIMAMWCNTVTHPCLPLALLRQLDDYYYECESMHGLEKTKIVAQSLRGAADWIENVCREVRRARGPVVCSTRARVCLLAAAAGWLLHGCAGYGGAASQARRAQAPQAGARRGQAFNQGPTSC